MARQPANARICPARITLQQAAAINRCDQSCAIMLVSSSKADVPQATEATTIGLAMQRHIWREWIVEKVRTGMTKPRSDFEIAED